MKFSQPRTCPICGNAAGGKGHAECSKELQQQHANKKRKAARRFHTNKSIDFFSKAFA